MRLMRYAGTGGEVKKTKEKSMIQKQINTDDFTLEIKLEFKDSDKTDFAYKE